MNTMHRWSCSVVAITSDSESVDPSSNLGKTSFFILHLKQFNYFYQFTIKFHSTIEFHSKYLSLLKFGTFSIPIQ